MIVGNGPKNQGSRKPGATSRLPLQERSRKPDIIQYIEDQGICIKCAIHTSQFGAFHQDAAGPHPGAGKSCNSDISRHNLGRAVDKNNLGALKPSCYPNRKTGSITV